MTTTHPETIRTVEDLREALETKGVEINAQTRRCRELNETLTYAAIAGDDTRPARADVRVPTTGSWTCRFSARTSKGSSPRLSLRRESVGSP